ncbi:MarR family transcriptional regulator [bacterium]|nr:MarR family transcriptional regulator [bacterium]MCB2201942.1 MarR family transcriptional regulator [bacterium]
MNEPNNTEHPFKVTDSSGLPSARDDSSQPASGNGMTDLELFQTTRRLLQAVESFSQGLRNRSQLALPQLVCLKTAADEGPVTATVIAHRARMSASTVVGILDELEEKQLIERKRDTRDRRLVNVTATEQGAEIVRQHALTLETGVLNALRKMSRSEQGSIVRTLRRLADHMEHPV